MQINKVGNQSFGINLLKYENDAAKVLFESQTTKISKHKMNSVWKKVSKMKPKVGPDIDVFVKKFPQDVTALSVQPHYEAVEFMPENKMTAKDIVNHFKNLIKSVNENRRSDLVIFNKK